MCFAQCQRPYYACWVVGAGRGQEEGKEGGFEQISGISTGVYILFHKGKLCQGVGFLVLLNGLRASDAGRPGPGR
jgi:hypothetical protein